MDESTQALDELFRQAIRRKVFSGAALSAGEPCRTVLRKTWGATRFGGVPVGEETLFDLASLTKPLVTACLCMDAVRRGHMELDAPLSRFFPRRMIPRDKRSVTVRHLLAHCSGLPPYRPFYRDLWGIPPAKRLETVVRWILSTPLLALPETECHYSDLGFILLGWILEEALGAPLDRLARRLLFRPAGVSLGFRRFGEEDGDGSAAGDPGVAATEFCPWRGRLLQGEVHDENAWMLGGVAGHAGLFGTAREVHRWLGILWRTLKGPSNPLGWPSSLVQELFRKQELVRGSTRTPGFDTPSPQGSSAGHCFSSSSVGHLGFTGTSFWMDLRREAVVVLLTNRVHASREGSAMSDFRPLAHDAVMRALGKGAWRCGD